MSTAAQPVAAALQRALTIADLRQQASRRLPRAIFDFVDRGSYDELSLRASTAAFDRYWLRQRVLVDVSRRELDASFLGQTWPLPLALGPAGMTGLVHPDGEIHACRAAQAAGIPYCLSTVSICSIEDVAAATTQPFWFQLYMLRDRGFVQSLVDRAEAAGCTALVLGADVAAHGQRHQDIRNGMSVPPRLTARNLIDMVRHPAWTAGILMGKRKTFGNFAGFGGAGSDISSITQWVNSQFDGAVTWKDVEWLRARWPHKLIIKGIMEPDDAAQAAEAGADAVVVSNHGGRQLDGARPTIDALGDVVQRVGGRMSVFLDGGVRRGQDVTRALALGAQGVWLGRAYLYGLACGGQPGVARALEIIRRELDTTLALMGKARAHDLSAADLSADDLSR